MSFSEGSVHMGEILGIVVMGFDMTNQLLIILSCFHQIQEENDSTVRQCYL
jgi:hypothetical protein